MKEIVYIFKNGRTLRLENEAVQAKEFYYSLEYFQEKYQNLKVIEDQDMLNKKYLLVDRLLQKLNLPINLSKIINKKNLQILKNADIIFSTNPGLAITLYPFIKIFKKHRKIKYLTINSGIFTNIFNSNVRSNKLKNIIVEGFLKTIDGVIFTSKTEYEIISSIYPEYKSKFINQIFSIDTNFWTTEKISSQEKEGVLFIGNNQNRDFSLAIEIAALLPNINFKFVTTKINNSEHLPKNIKLIKGDWNQNILSDSDIKDMYETSRIVFLPVEDTLVASGQSVAMQSMSMGTPVIISKTMGFWDYENFINDENIFLIETNTAHNWADKINDLYGDYVLLNRIAHNGEELIHSKFNLEIFSNFLEAVFEFGNEG
jgi:glycosyltransferase involved in cell wall biosynthesis